MLKVTLTPGSAYNIDFIHLIEQELDKALKPIGFVRTKSSKGETVTFDYYQFGIAIDQEKERIG